MAQHSSRISGFNALPFKERRRRILETLPASDIDREAVLATGGLCAETAGCMIENALGTYALPFGIGLNFRIDGRDRFAPMVVEEPSVIAAASNAARLVRTGGGFKTEALGDTMIAQIQVDGVADPAGARERLESAKGELMARASVAVPGLVARGGGPVRLEVRDLGDGFMVVHVHVNCLDAMGANLLNTLAEALGPAVAELARGRLGLRILSNLCEGRRVRVRARVPATGLGATEEEGIRVAEAVEQASRFAEKDPYRAATHNKGIMNGVDAVVLATGNDFRAVEAGAHAYACQSGQYRPLATWRREGSALVGELVLPLALGIVGGTLRLHPLARLALEISESKSAADLSALAASVGLASNLAALRALATDGIQRGHMMLHARSVAAAAGARAEELEQVAQRLWQASAVTPSAAQRLVAELRSQGALGEQPSSL
jgi:hydroxymethylglutaryl-CoA reductase